MQIDDLTSVCEIENEAFTHPWTYDDFLNELNSNPYANYVVLEENQQIIAYVGIWIIYEKAQITTIAVNSKYRGMKYSKVLMDYVDQLCVKSNVELVSLEVRISNKKAINLYEGFGFKKSGIRKDYYQDNHEDAHLMIKDYKGD
jgi:ribosomal-protein-alanine N-acetyltransferase